MNTSEDHKVPEASLATPAGTSRRDFLVRAGAVGIAGTGLMQVLAACGSTGGATGGSSAGTVTTAQATNMGSTQSLISAVTKQVVMDPKYAGKGTTLKCGYIGPLSGPGQPYSIDQLAGLKSAEKIIPMLGGPSLDITYLDNESGNAQAGINAARQLTAQGVELLFSSYVGDLGALFSPVASAEMFTIDAGGTSPVAWSHPFFWNAAQDWTQSLPGAFAFLRKQDGDAKTIVQVGADEGPELNKQTEEAYRSGAEEQGFELTKTIHVPEGSTQFSSALTEVRDANPDIVSLEITNYVGNFMQQYLQAGLTAKVNGGVLNPVDLQVGGSALNGVMSTSAYFFPNRPSNQLGALLVDQYVGERTDLEPNWNAGFFFQAAMNMWELSMLCRKAGQEPTGSNMNAQMEKSPTLHSPFGGTDKKIATVSYDPETHIPKTGSVSSCEIQDESFILVATNNLEGTEYSPFKPGIKVT